MKQLLIIPDVNDREATLSLMEAYHVGVEYNDFFHPTILDDREKIKEKRK